MWVAEKIADVMLGGDILDPRRDGTEIDWEGMKAEKPRRTVVATLPRIQLELALGAANRRLKEELDPEKCQELISKAKQLAENDEFAAELGESCAMTVKGLPGSKLEAQISGTGVAFEVLCDEMWGRSSGVREVGSKMGADPASPGLEKVGAQL